MDKDVFVVLNEGQLVFASHDRDEAMIKSEELTEESIADTAKDNDWDVNDPVEYDKAVLQNGMDGGCYDVYRIRSNYLIEDTDYELPDGSLISINDVLDMVGDEDEFDFEQLFENQEDY